MKGTLEYVNREVIVTGIDEDSLSPIFRAYFSELKEVYSKHMEKMSDDNRVPIGKLEITLQLASMEISESKKK